MRINVAIVQLARLKKIFRQEERAMEINVGTLDRIMRVVVGLALIAVALGYIPGYQTMWAWIGVIPLVTGVFGTCPVYSIFGINTCRST